MKVCIRKEENIVKKSLFGIISLAVILIVFALVGNSAWALKNVCPECNKMIKDLDLTNCIDCGKVINQCLVCKTINPVKNDNCSKCDASLAESRVLRTIDKNTRENLKLGESSRAQIEMALGQIKERVAINGMTEELAAEQVELLTQLGWWSKANFTANEFITKYPSSSKTSVVATCQVTALRNLGFLALQEKSYGLAGKYLQEALVIDPKDKKSKDLLKKIGSRK